VNDFNKICAITWGKNTNFVGLQEHENKIIKQSFRPQRSDLQKCSALASLGVWDLSKSGPEPE